MNVIKLCSSISVLLVLALPGAYAANNTGTVAVELRPFKLEYQAYAQVEPRNILPIRAAATGEVSTLTVVPGLHVGKGELLAILTGPDYDAEVAAARARWQAAKVVLSTTRHNYPDFSTVQDLASADAVYKEAHAALTRIRAVGKVRAPVSGTVLTLNMSSGERVSPGTTLLRLLPDNGVWLRANLYGADTGRIQSGMRGRFYPQDGAAAIPVRVHAVVPPQTVGGGVSVTCVADTTAIWQDGEAGTLVIAASPVQQLPAVPNVALVMDQGKWWVLLSDTHGLRRQPVEIGPSVGEWTFIRHGVRADERVVAVNAYLLFHADISRHYSPPD